ncbi:MAG TPA: hypothetical protein VFH83_14115 [Spirochaetia bacterium]|nr:hypothetical protein [Spirochaetia bacterium]
MNRLNAAGPILAIFSAALLTMGCATITPANTQKPDVQFTVSVDSIPRGASVYAVNADGTLGALLGLTPYQWRVGLSMARDSSGAPAFGYAAQLFGPPGISLGTVHKGYGFFSADEWSWQNLLISVAVVKEGLPTTWYANRVVARVGQGPNGAYPYPPQDVTVTLPLGAQASALPAQPPETIIVPAPYPWPHRWVYPYRWRRHRP